jgi:NADP-dependent aldehyde dehydrogenase
MQLTGSNIIGAEFSSLGVMRYSALSPVSHEALPGSFYEATPAELDRACDLASEAHQEMQSLAPESVAGFLAILAARLDEHRSTLIARCASETALTSPRLDSELDRTISQLRLFSDVVKSGSALDLHNEAGDPDRKPTPKPGIRRWSIGIGPVAVFGAANFPFAFSVAGGDTASAIAARCPVVVKAHPAHPGTSELVSRIISETVALLRLPLGMFSMLHGKSASVSLALVQDPRIKAVGFTGSLQAGRALIGASCQRDDPIPVFAEMGSLNPVFLLPGALRERCKEIADGLVGAITLGSGQFCTSPGLLVGVKSKELDALVERIGAQFRQFTPAPMLHSGILLGFRQGVQRWTQVPGMVFVTESQPDARAVTPALGKVSGEDFLACPALCEEVFGPAAVVVVCDSVKHQLDVARAIRGSLTATVHAAESDLDSARALIPLLQRFAGRLIWNGYPTGVEVCSAMNHGGPYPASSDSRFTAVGHDAIRRWLRPICFQNFPAELLPTQLRVD